jgi:hypothetical protein
MAYLRHIALTQGPAAPATVAIVTRGVPEWARWQAEAELREVFPDARPGQVGTSDLVVLVGLADGIDAWAAETLAQAPGASIWCYPVDLGRIAVVTGGTRRGRQRERAWAARIESWGGRHRARWSLLGDVGRLVDRTLR